MAGRGRFTREEWKTPTEAMRKSKGRRLILSPEVHAALDALPDGSRSANADAALREWFGLPAREDSPVRPERRR